VVGFDIAKAFPKVKALDLLSPSGGGLNANLRAPTAYADIAVSDVCT